MLKTRNGDIIGSVSGDVNGGVPDRLFLFPELKDVWGVPYTRQHLSRLEAARRFPRRVRCGARIGWLGSELSRWQQGLVEARDGEAA